MFCCPSIDHPEVAAAIKEAAKEAGSSSAEEYTVKFNVDILAPIVKHADSQVKNEHVNMTLYMYLHAPILCMGC